MLSLFKLLIAGGAGFTIKWNNFYVDLKRMPASNGNMDAWAKLKADDQDALLELYNCHYLGLINYGLKLTGNRNLANDCITRILLRLWDARNKLPDVENVRSYLMTCLRNEIFAEVKAEGNRLSKNRLSAFTGDNTQASYEEYLIALQSDSELKERLHKALDKLTPREKELLQMKFFEDVDYDEIARRCGITRRTAYNIIHAAVKTLKAELTQQKGNKTFSFYSKFLQFCFL